MFSASWKSDNSPARISGCLYPPHDAVRGQIALNVPAITTKLKFITKQMHMGQGRTREGLISTCCWLAGAGL